MRKIYIPIAVLVAALIGLTGCHNDHHASPTSINQGVSNLNKNIQYDCENISMIFDESLKEIIAAHETLRPLYTEISRKYPIPRRGFNVFDHSHAKQQALLMNSLISLFNDGVPVPRYGIATKDSFINVFETKMWMWKDNNKCESLIYDPTKKDHDLATIRAKITDLGDTVNDFINSTDAVLEFDYTNFDKQYHSLIAQFWSQVYVADMKGYDLRKIINGMKQDVQIINSIVNH